MRISIGMALLGLTFTGLALAGCAGPEGNPDGQPYANDPGGAIAVKPQFLGQDAYNPYGQSAAFEDMQAGQAVVKPAPTPPLDLTTKGAR